MTLRLEVIDHQGFVDKMNRLGQKGRTAMTHILNNGADSLESGMKSKVRVKTGYTQSTIHVSQKATENSLQAEVTAGGAAEYLEKGTPPHIILPRNAKVLAFELGGETVFATEVHHPGTKARPFAKPTVDAVRNTIASEAAAILRREVSF